MHLINRFIEFNNYFHLLLRLRRRRRRRKQVYLFTSPQFVSLNFGLSPLDAVAALVTYSLACQQWTIEKVSGWAREQAFLLFSVQSGQAKSKRRTAAWEGHVSEQPKGSCAREGVWEGNSGAAVSDNSFSEAWKHMQIFKSHAGNADTKTHTNTDTEGEGNVWGQSRKVKEVTTKSVQS